MTKAQLMYLIADSGATKADWRLVSPSGMARALHTDGLSPYYQTTEQMTTTLREQLLPQLAGADVEAVYYYGTGCIDAPTCELVADALRSALPNLQTVTVNSDMLGAARGAAGHEPGIVCILGTGSNACCYDGQQLTRGIQSLGFWLGDEGSGGYLGKTLVRQYFQNQLPADLHDAFAARYGLDRATLLENAYRKPYPNRYFASFTPFLSENIAHPHIVTLLIDAFTLFLTTYVRPFPEAQRWPVHFVGSIAHYFSNQLQQAVSQLDMQLGHIQKAPADGLMEFHKRAV